MSHQRYVRSPRPRMRASFDGLATKLGHLRRNNRGSVAALAALAFPVLIGGMGLGAEVGYWYLTERKLQHAADLSAFSAAVRLSQGDDDDRLEEIALHIATQSGFDDAQGTIEVYHPPISGPNAGDATMVEVVLTEDIERSFSGFFQDDEVNVRGRAVARINAAPDPACLIALAPSGAQTLAVTGNGAVTLNSCVAVANSTDSQGAFVKGSGSLSAKCTYSGSGAAYGQKTNSIVSQCEPEVQEDTVADPYAAVVAPTKAATCYEAGKKQPAIPATPTRTEGGLKIWDLCALAIESDMTLEAGLYIIYGGDITDTGRTRSPGPA
jgi:hypothetical protein